MRDRSASLSLFALIAAGAVVELAFAGLGTSNSFDVQGFLITAGDLHADPLQVYDSMRWPYPPGLMPWLFVATEISTGGLAFDLALRLPQVLANVGIALIVYDLLARRGLPEQARLIASGLVLLGPVFLAVLYHGQIDSFATLFAIAAVWAWERGVARRALTVGLLIGLGAAVKTVPIFMLFALLPWARDAKERVTLVLAAFAVPLLALAPFLIADGPDTVEALRSNQGIPGLGGLSLALIGGVQSTDGIAFTGGLVDFWRDLFGIDSVAVALRLLELQQLIVAVAVLATGALVWRRKVAPVEGAALIWLAVLALNPNFAWQYLIWGLPFFIAAGFVVESLVLQLLAAVPLALYFFPLEPSKQVADYVYTPLALVVWLALVVALVIAVTRIIRMRPEPAVMPAVDARAVT